MGQDLIQTFPSQLLSSNNNNNYFPCPASSQPKMSVDIALFWRTGFPIAGDGYHRRPEKAKVSALGPRRRADTDGKEGKSVLVFGGKKSESIECNGEGETGVGV